MKANATFNRSKNMISNTTYHWFDLIAYKYKTLVEFNDKRFKKGEGFF